MRASHPAQNHLSSPRMPTEQTEQKNAEGTGPDWASWLQRHSGRLFFFAVHWNAEDPEDALQHALVKTAHAVAEGRCDADDNAILRYAFITLRSKLHRAHRDMERRYAGERAWGEEMHLLESDEATEEECRCVEAAVRKLPPEEAEVVVLHLWEGMTFQDIGELLDINRHTAAARYRRALTDIRELITHFQQ